MSEKHYCGKAKSNDYGIRLRVCLSDIPEEFISEFNGKKYVTLDINRLRQIDQKGNDHTAIVNTWKPNGQPQSAPVPQQQENPDDLPF